MRVSPGLLLLLLAASQVSAYADEDDAQSTDKPSPAVPPYYSEASCPVDATVDSPDDYYPPGSLRRMESGEVIIEFTAEIGAKYARDVVLVTSSGFDDLDRAALKLGRRLAVTTVCGAQRVRRSILFDVWRDPREEPMSFGCLVSHPQFMSVTIFSIDAP
jgi:TonB family protein